jgi:sugar phosphate isomerase/epimerase
LPQVFEELATMGGTVIEINGNAQRHHDIALDSSTIPQILTWAKQSGLTIRSLSGYCDFAITHALDANAEVALDAEVARLMATCRAASEMEVPIVRTFVGDVKPGITLEGTRRGIVAALRKASALAAVLGVTLGIENHGRLINDGPALVALVQEVGASNLGFTLDTGNFAWAGHGPDEVRADLEAVLPHVVSVHVKDGKWTDQGFVFVPAGEGDLPLAWLLARLRTQGYDGPVYSEYEGGESFREGTRRSIAFLKSIVSGAAQQQGRRL